MTTLFGKNIMVTGGAGFIGSHLVDRLINEMPAKLVVVDNLLLGRKENLRSAKTSFPGLQEYLAPTDDVTDFQRMEAILRDETIDVVFDFATIPLPVSLERPQWSYQQIISMAANLCELCRLGLFANLIHCSTSEVYGTSQYVPMDEVHPYGPQTAYAAGKAAADLLVKAYVTVYGIDALIVRPFNTYGPRQNDQAYAGVIPCFIRSIMNDQRPVVTGDGHQTRDFIYVADAVEAIVQVARADVAPGTIVNIAAENEIEIVELGRLLYKVADRTFDPIFVPARVGDVFRHAAGAENLRRLTGFTPKVPMTEGLHRTLQWYMEKRDREHGQ